MQTERTDGGNGPIAGSLLDDRRRPGRRADISAELLPLLRGMASISTDPSAVLDKNPDPLSEARGVVTGLRLSVICWTVIGVTLWFLL